MRKARTINVVITGTPIMDDLFVHLVATRLVQINNAKIQTLKRLKKIKQDYLKRR